MGIFPPTGTSWPGCSPNLSSVSVVAILLSPVSLPFHSIRNSESWLIVLRRLATPIRCHRGRKKLISLLLVIVSQMPVRGCVFSQGGR